MDIDKGGVHSTVSGNGSGLRQQESFGSLQGRDLSMRKFGGELWGPVGLVVNVTLRGVELDSGENGDGFNLGEISRDQLVQRIPERGWDTLEVATEASAR